MSTSFWSDDPYALVQPESLASVFPADGMTLSEKLNALVRLSWYVAIVLKCFGVTWYIVLLPLFTMLVTYVVHTDQTGSQATDQPPLHRRVFGALAAAVDTLRGKTSTSDETSEEEDDSSRPTKARTTNNHKEEAPKKNATKTTGGEVEEGFANPSLPASLSNLYVDAVQHGVYPNAPDALQHDAPPFAYERYNTIGANASPKWAPVLGAAARTCQTCTRPTPTNPFANMLVPEMGKPRTRACARTSRIAQAQNAAFNEGAQVVNPSDVFAHTSGQRQFFTMPWTTTPNDPHGDYQAWLYDIAPTKKEEGLVSGERAMGSGLLA